MTGLSSLLSIVPKEIEGVPSFLVESLTVTVIFALLFPPETVIVVVPGATPNTSPFLTFAIFSLRLVQLKLEAFALPILFMVTFAVEFLSTESVELTVQSEGHKASSE